MNYQLYWSSDSDLDPDNWAVYDNSGHEADAEQPYILGGLHNDTNYTLYLDTHFGDEQHRQQLKAGRPMAMGLETGPGMGAPLAIESDDEGNLVLAGTHRFAALVTGGLVNLQQTGDQLHPGASVLVSGTVETMARDAQGRLYIGGLFTEVKGEPRRNIARFTAEGELDSSFVPETNGRVRKLLVDNNRIIIAGDFTQVSSEVSLHGRNYLAALTDNGTVQSWNPNPNDLVKDMVLTDSHLIVAGQFETFGGANRGGMAAFDRSLNLPLSTGRQANAAFAGSSASVESLSIDGNRLLIGGGFNTVNSTNRVSFAVLNISNGDVLPINANITANCCVESVLAHNGVYYLSGAISNTDTSIRAKAITAEGDALDWPKVQPNVQPSQLFAMGDLIVASGGFERVGDEPRLGIAAFNSEGDLLPEWNIKTRINDILTNEGGLWLASNGIGWREPVPNIVTFTRNGNLLNWRPVSDLKTPGSVTSMVRHGDALYLSGDFEELEPTDGDASPVYRSGLAAIDINTGALLPWNPSLNAGGIVNALVPYNDTILLAGQFTQVNGAGRHRLALVTADTGTVSFINFAEPNNRITAAQRRGNTLYAMGDFTTVDGAARAGFAAFNLDNGGRMELSITLNDTLRDFTIIGDTSLFLAGDFTIVDGNARSGLALYDLNPSTTGLLSWNPTVVGQPRLIFNMPNGVLVRGINDSFVVNGTYMMLPVLSLFSNGNPVRNSSNPLSGALRSIKDFDDLSCGVTDSFLKDNSRWRMGVFV